MNLNQLYRHGNVASPSTKFMPRSQVIQQTGVDAGSGFHNFANQAIASAAAVGDERARRADYQFGEQQTLANKRADQEYKLGRMAERTRRRQLSQQQSLTQDQMSHEQSMAQQQYQQQAALAQAAQQAAMRQAQLGSQTDLQRAQLSSQAGIQRQDLANQGALARTQAQISAGQEEAQQRLLASMGQSMMGHYTPESIQSAMFPATNPTQPQPSTENRVEYLPDGTPKYINQVYEQPGQPGGLAGIDWGQLQAPQANSNDLMERIDAMAKISGQINDIQNSVGIGDEASRNQQVNNLMALRDSIAAGIPGFNTNGTAPTHQGRAPNPQYQATNQESQPRQTSNSPIGNFVNWISQADKGLTSSASNLADSAYQRTFNYTNYANSQQPGSGSAPQSNRQNESDDWRLWVQ